jgi:hypothetical protein
MSGTCSTHGKDTNCIFWGGETERREIGRPICKSEDDIKIDIGEIVFFCAKWIHVGRYKFQY